LSQLIGKLSNTGNNVAITNNIDIFKGDIDSLVKDLINNDVSTEDAHELKNILSSDSPNENEKKFGEKTNKWISKMISKSLDGTWAIGIGAAGKLLADAIKAFYGWH
jgi:hypothetical protein